MPERHVYLTPSLPSLSGSNAERIRFLLRGLPIAYAYTPEDGSLKSTSHRALSPLGITSRPLEGLNPVGLDVSREEIDKRIEAALSTIAYEVSNFGVIASPEVSRHILGAVGEKDNKLPRVGELYLLDPNVKRGTLQLKGIIKAPFTLTTE